MKNHSKAIPDRLYQDVSFLTSISPARNYRNHDSLKKAADYIHQELGKLDPDQLEYQDFKVKSGETYQNVSSLFKGESNERIIVGAHYDVWDNQPGADDNGSAVAGMLETARLLNEYRKQNPLPYTIELVGYCLEEPPFFAGEEMGSAVHARAIVKNKVPVKLMICYEMIGYFSDEPGSQGYPHPSLQEWYPNTGNFIIVGGNSSQKGIAENLAQLMQPHSKVPVYPVSSRVTDSLVDLSDHRNYWKHDIPAVMINDTSFMRNPNYHKETDTIDTLDFEKIAEVVNGVSGAILNLKG